MIDRERDREREGSKCHFNLGMTTRQQENINRNRNLDTFSLSNNKHFKNFFLLTNFLLLKLKQKQKTQVGNLINFFLK